MKLFKNKEKSKRKNGFTFVELMAVIVVVGIILVLTIPTFIANINGAKEETKVAFQKSLNNGLERWIEENKDRLIIDVNADILEKEGVKIYKLKKKEKDADGKDYIRLSDLLGAGMISKSEITNPSTGVTCDPTSIVDVYKDDNFVYYFSYKICGLEKKVEFSKYVEKISVTSIETSQTINLKESEEYTINYNVLPKNASNKNVTFTSSDENIATVDSAGKVSAKKGGTAKITISSKENSNIYTNIIVNVSSNEVELTRITVNPSSISLSVGSEHSIITSVEPSNATNPTLEYASDNKSVVTVDSDGKISAKSQGTAKITISSKNNSEITTTLEVNVYQPVTNITVDKEDITLNTGETSKIGVKVEPSNATNPTLKYTSSDENIATVDSAGEVSAKEKGTAKVTVTCENITKTITINVIEFSDFSGDKSNANAPDLETGLIPVVYKGDGIWKVVDTTKDWYNYDKGIWANAITVISDKKNTYVPGYEFYAVASTKEGESTGLLAMFVWIPRFSYTIYKSNGKALDGNNASDISSTTPGAIDIKFIPTTTTETGSAAYTTSGSISGWYTHPAFTFGNKELSGIWVGKFETGDDKLNDEKGGFIPKIVANAYRHTSVTVSECFNKAQEFNKSKSSYYTMSGDTHLMRNVDWAAVAYLSQSKYGKYGNTNYSESNKEIYINNDEKFTGMSSCRTGANLNSSSVVYSYFAGDKELCGAGASTTGNVYGIYDMVGGGSEYVMGNYNDTVASSGFSSSWFTTEGNAKYYDKYFDTGIQTSKEYKGHALYETMGWYSDYKNDFSSSSKYAWLCRGGNYSEKSNSKVQGIFYFNTKRGGQSGNDSYHVVLTNQ